MKPKKQKNCGICGKSMPRHTRNVSYCSDKCQKVRREQINEAKRTQFTEIICDQCDKLFLPINPRQKRCSQACRSAHQKNRYEIENKREFSIFNRDGFRCIYCGKSSIEDNIKLNIDHLIPFSENNIHSIDNLITSCQKCNTSKYNKILTSEILERIKLVINTRNNKLTYQQLHDINMEINSINNRNR
jgi:5-methylcytosine-specific restriction endonuclease McrA